MQKALAALKSNFNQIKSLKNHASDYPLIQADNLGVKFEHGKKKTDFRSYLHGLATNIGNKKDEGFWALKDISFKGYTGDILGIIGPNGAGKTTLCRVLIGLLKPDHGRIIVNGEVSALLSLGTGFNEELSGRENILLNGMVLGFSRQYMTRLLPSIEEFSGIGSFLKEPMKYYSSGMQARLGFSIAALIESEILVIDEVLGTGDLEFQERAAKKMWKMVENAKMVITVSHSLNFIKKNCNRAIWLEKGKIKAVGDPVEITELYREQAAACNKPGKKRLISLQETRTEAGKIKVVDAKRLGINFNVSGKQFWALQDIDFSVYEKEIIGIIGPNGAGKTTLCRALCGLYKPDSGWLTVKGSVTALLSFGAGFNGQLPGRDNIYLNGMMLGIPKNYIQKTEQEIIDFSGIGKFIDKPMKQYSSGMRSRLGFSIAAMLQPDLLIVDEALTAGDEEFKEKATLKMQEMIDEAKAVIIVTHSLDIVEKVCTRAILLKNGKMIFDGEPNDCIAQYK